MVQSVKSISSQQEHQKDRMAEWGLSRNGHLPMTEKANVGFGMVARVTWPGSWNVTPVAQKRLKCVDPNLNISRKSGPADRQAV